MNNMYCKKSPCENCPYRKDAPLQLWHKSEFKQLLASESSEMGVIYNCHKNDGNVCIGWLMDQDKRRHPSIMLRISLIKHKVTRKYLDSLRCKSELFPSVKEMIQANFPELLE